MSLAYIASSYSTYKPISHIGDTWLSIVPDFAVQDRTYDLSYLLPVDWQKVIVDFIPSIQGLCSLHCQLLNGELGELAGTLRITEAIGGGTWRFARSENIQKALEASFEKERKSPGDILAWCVDAIAWIHPFYNGNRRTIWSYTNIWLLSKGYSPIAWESIRESIWEKNITLSGDQRLSILASIYIHQS